MIQLKEVVENLLGQRLSSVKYKVSMTFSKEKAANGANTESGEEVFFPSGFNFLTCIYQASTGMWYL